MRSTAAACMGLLFTRVPSLSLVIRNTPVAHREGSALWGSRQGASELLFPRSQEFCVPEPACALPRVCRLEVGPISHMSSRDMDDYDEPQDDEEFARRLQQQEDVLAGGEGAAYGGGRAEAEGLALRGSHVS